MQETTMRFASRHLLLHFRKAFALACLACLVLVAPMAGAAVIEMRVATAYAADNFQTVNLQRYADEVAPQIFDAIERKAREVLTDALDESDGATDDTDRDGVPR